MKLNKLNKVAKALSYPVTPIPKKPSKYKPSERKKFTMSIARELGGLAPYELKAIELLRRDEEKKCKKFMKKRLGSLKMAKKKIELLNEEMRAART